jgi:hypothetical protein
VPDHFVDEPVGIAWVVGQNRQAHAGLLHGEQHSGTRLSVAGRQAVLMSAGEVQRSGQCGRDGTYGGLVVGATAESENFWHQVCTLHPFSVLTNCT